MRERKEAGLRSRARPRKKKRYQLATRLARVGAKPRERARGAGVIPMSQGDTMRKVRRAQVKGIQRNRGGGGGVGFISVRLRAAGTSSIRRGGEGRKDNRGK